MDAVVFTIAGQRYAVPVSRIRTIVRAVAPSHLPGAPDLVKGIVNFHGRLVPVLDVRRRFGHPARPTALSDMLLMADGGTRDVALHVDHVLGVEAIAEEAVVDPTSLVRNSPFIAGLAALPDGTLLIHDPSAFLAESESDELEAALAAGAPA
jgi:purine-binding chemotaxis protein CheW